MQAAMIAVATLFNSLWVGAVLALVVWALLNILPNLNATTRYAAWCVALAAALLVPLAIAIPQISVLQPSQSVRAPQTHVAQFTRAAQHARAASATARTAPQSAVPVAGAIASAPHFGLRAHLSLPVQVALGIVGLWIVAALFLLIRLAFNLYRLESLKRDALPLPMDYRDHLARWMTAEKGARDVRLCVSEHIEVPVAVGLFDSMVLIPRHLLDTLSEKEIDQIALHELAHLRRADDWTNGFQRIIQAIFFFNPAIIFMAQQLDLEREVACDDWVLRQTGDVRPYATCLTRMAEVTAWPHRALAAPGVFVTRRGLSVRVERLLRAGRNIRTSVSFGPAGAVAAVLIVLFFIAQNVAPSFAVTLPAAAQQASAHSTAHALTSTRSASTIRIAGKLPARATVSQTLFGSTSQNAHASGALVAESPQVTVTARAKGAGSAPSRSARTPVKRLRRYWNTNCNCDVNVAPFDVHVPNVHVNVPAVHVDVPAMDVNVPGTSVHVPAINVNVPSMRYKVPVGYTGRLKRVASLGNAGSCTGCDFTGVQWAGRNLERIALTGSDFSKADLHGANLSYANLSGVDFSGANLRGVNFSYASLEGCDMSGADITGAIFTGAHINGCDISVDHLAPAQAKAVLSGCTGCDFRNANLRGQDLRGIAVVGDDFRNADLRGADLRNASFSGVDLHNAKLDGAQLEGASFTGCDFTGVDLRNVDLSRTQIVGSKITFMR